MTRQSIIWWGLLAGLVALMGWWGLVPKIGTATQAEVRAHIAPELLQPLPRPDGGVARFEAMRRALDSLPPEPVLGRPRRNLPQLALTNPVVGEVMDILGAGPIDRAREVQPLPGPINAWQNISQSRLYTSVRRLANDLAGTATSAADMGDWARARQHMEASCLLLDRLFESDARLEDRRWTIAIELIVYRSAFNLAVRPDMPAGLAERLAVLLVKDRHDPASLLRVLQGEMQLLLLVRMGEQPASSYAAGTYDPLETAELLSTRFLEMVREAGLPAARQSGLSNFEVLVRQSELSPYRMVISNSSAYRDRDSYLTWPLRRIRLNTAHNSIGRIDAAAYPDGNLMNRMQEARSLQDQVAAVLAVVRFRQRAGRDPRDYAELVTTGLLRAAPMDHRTDTPLSFDLKALFEQQGSRRN